MEKKPDHKKKSFVAFARYSGIATEMCFYIIIGIFGGKALDEKLNLTKPVFTMIFSFLGLAIAFYRIFSSLKKMD